MHMGKFICNARLFICYNLHYCALRVSMLSFKPSEMAVSWSEPAVLVLWIITCARPLKAGMLNSLQSLSFGWSLRHVIHLRGIAARFRAHIVAVEPNAGIAEDAVELQQQVLA